LNHYPNENSNFLITYYNYHKIDPIDVGLWLMRVLKLWFCRYADYGQWKYSKQITNTIEYRIQYQLFNLLLYDHIIMSVANVL